MKFKHRKRKPVRKIMGWREFKASSGNAARITVYWTGAVHEPSNEFKIAVDVNWDRPQSKSDIAESEKVVGDFLKVTLHGMDQRLVSVPVASEADADVTIDETLRGDLI